MAEALTPVSLATEARRRYLAYGMSVVTARALPDVRDGLKPVQRRILFTMGQDLGLGPEARLAKSAKVVGQVMGSYHPHGDQAIYEAMVRMAQPFAMRHPLVHGHGNFGSIDDDPPAAMRYTECKLRPLAMELLDELAKGTVAFRPSYDGTKEEPEVLPARFPQLLVNGASGIAVGMATSIPPHNLAEVIAACLILIDDREAPLARLLEVVRGPDLPTGAELVASREQLRAIYETGRGTLRMRATWKSERDGRQRLIIVDAIPYGVDKAPAVERIGELIRTRKLPQAVGVRDESTDDIRIVIELRQDADPAKVMAFLHRNTTLGEPLAVNLTCLVPEGGATRPLQLGLREALVRFLDFRLEVVTKRLAFDLAKVEERIHILEGFARVFDGLDEALALVRRSEGREDARQKLMRRFELDERQAEAVLETRIYRLARLAIEEVVAELEAKRKEQKRLRALLASEPKRWEVVRSELADISLRYGEPRRTRIIEGGGEDLAYDAEEFIPDEDTHVVVTRDGWIKRVARLKTPTATRVREGDDVAFVLPGSTRASLAVFSSLGAAYVMRIHEVPSTSGHGEPIQKHFKFADGERIVGAVSLDARLLERLLGAEPPSPASGAGALVGEGALGAAAGGAAEVEREPDADLADGDDGAGDAGDADGAADGAAEGGGEAVEGPLLFAATARGRVLRFALAAHAEPSNRSGRRFVRLAGEGDEVVRVELCTPAKPYVAMASAKGRAIVYALDEVSALAGPGKGVRGMKLEAGDRIVACALSSGRGDALVVETSRGAEQAIAVSDDRRQARGGRGRELLKRDGFVREVPRPVEVIRLFEREGGAEEESGEAEAEPEAEAEAEAAPTSLPPAEEDA